MKTTAILVDGGFFVRRFGTAYPDLDRHDPKAVADQLNKMCLAHLYSRGRQGQGNNRVAELYRIYFYDYPPLESGFTRRSPRRHSISRPSLRRCFERRSMPSFGRTERRHCGWDDLTRRTVPGRSGRL